MKIIKNFLLISLITFGLLETGLRLFFAQELFYPAPDPNPEHTFWQASGELGWEHVPNSEGLFSNGGFHGYVSIGDDGIRKNSRDGTYIEGYRNIFFIGDSTTASLEVDDHETVPALLEQHLRELGEKVNVLNMGVRAYGTDQAVLLALAMADKYQPERIIYMFTGNDIMNNNEISIPSRNYSKDIFIRERGETTFKRYRKPIDNPAEKKDAFVVMDPDCHPLVNAVTRIAPGDLSEPWALTGWKKRVTDYSYVFRAIRHVINMRTDKKDTGRRPDLDLYDLVYNQGIAWPGNLSDTYRDDGATRARCSEYFDDQISFLLGKLRGIESANRIHLVRWPSIGDFGKGPSDRVSPNRRLFQNLLRSKHIDSYTDLVVALTADGRERKDFTCLGDPHFCEAGNRWIFTQIVESLH